MKVLFASAEAAPFFKTGGLGDVAYALPKELAKQGVDIRVVLPYYTQTPQQYKDQIQEIAHFRFQLGGRNVYCGIKYLEMDGVKYYFIDNLAYFDRPALYGQWDDGEPQSHQLLTCSCGLECGGLDLEPKYLQPSAHCRTAGFDASCPTEDHRPAPASIGTAP